MGRFLSSKKPADDSELGTFLREVWEAIELKLPIQDRKGIYSVERRQNGQALIFSDEPKGKAAVAASTTFPFEIIHAAHATDSDLDWITFQVRPGLVIVSGEPIEASGVSTNIEAEEGKDIYWFYVEVDGALETAEIKHTSETQDWSFTKIPIGWVDTLTGALSEPPTSEITQFITDNLFVPAIEGGGGGMQWRGVWSPAPVIPYSVQDVVIVQTGVNAGTYVSVLADNPNDPATGIGWVQIAPGNNTIGNWT